MKKLVIYSLIFLSLFSACKDSKTETPKKHLSKNIQYAKGFSVEDFSDFKILRVSKPWPNANKTFVYVLKKKNITLPDSLQLYPSVQIPIKKMVVTSTTHIPALEMLDVQQTLVGFPDLNFISSPKTYQLVKNGKIREVGQNEKLNTETLIDLNPNVVVSFGIDNNNPSLNLIEKSGIPVFINGDWVEETPLGKAEWIKFFGALYDKDAKAQEIFDEIVNDYNQLLQIAQKAKSRPTVFCNAIFNDQWFLPQGQNWFAVMMDQAKGDYLWKNTKGSGSLSLSFETVFEKANQADFWIAPGNYETKTKLIAENSHYQDFKAFKTNKVFTFANKKGPNGGLIYFEWAAARPDWLLKDLLAILHPELLPNHSFHFYQPLQ